MRLLILAAASALAVAACSKPTELAEGGNAPEEAAATEAAMEHSGDHSGHDMGEMTEDMSAMDAADDVNMAETPDGHTFHTFPDKIEAIHLPVAEGETWTVQVDNETLVAIESAADETMPDGTVHHVIKGKPLAAGNAVVTVARSAEGAEPSETRTIHFMVH